MTSEKTTIEKILAILTVIFLFLLVGFFLFSISINNKEKTLALKDKVLKQIIANEDREKLEKIYFATSTELEITSKSYLTLAIANHGATKILAERDPNMPLPMASITKLMVAIITLENINPETEVIATLDYIGKEESAFILEVIKSYKVKDLLANALISSDNDSARLLSSTLGENNFVAKMNLKTQELGLVQTNFFNVTGLDPTATSTDNISGINTSTATDLANLLIYIKNKHPEILRITTEIQYSFCDINNYCKNVTSTDKLLEDVTFPLKILGGKTGNTDLAGKNLILVTNIVDGISLINVVLGSKDNFADMLTLINNVKIKK